MIKRTKGEALLITVAESIGSTLGTIAAKADAAQQVLNPGRVAHAIKREAKQLRQKSTVTARKARRAVAANLRGNKLTTGSKRGLRRESSFVKRTVVHGTAKARASRRTRDRR
jgi:uncharacterized protein YaiL (DUF2058 family)